MRRFPPSPITSLVDDAPLYNLGESTCRDLDVAELLGTGGAENLADVPLGYGTSAGTAELRHLVAVKEGVADQEVLVTTGAAGALFLIALLLADGDDSEIVVVQPSFPPALAALQALRAHIVTVQLTFTDGYRLEPATLRSKLSPRTRMVQLASPQNPSGVVFGRDEIERALADMARICPDAVLVVDQTYREARYGSDPEVPSLAAMSPRVITCSSVSKSHGAPGLRIGWLTVRNPELLDQLRLARFATSISCGTLDEFLATELLQRAEAVLAPRREFLARALDVVETWVESQRDVVRWVRPDAGAFCCIQVDPTTFGPGDISSFHTRLAGRGTLVAPGTWFGDGENVFRVGFGYEPMEKLEAGLQQITAALRTR